MHRLRSALREHRHVFIVVALLTLVTTFPTIVYVFKTDVFWLPVDRFNDILIKFWDVWHWRLFANGQAGFFHSETIFFPQGVSLAYHPLFVWHTITVNLLNLVMPISNAYCLAYTLIVASSALSAYIFINHLLRDKWIALVGAVIFGFSPHVMVHITWPEIGFVVTLPLALYFLHRGLTEDRRVWMVSAGALAGLTTFVTMYVYVCLLMTLLGYALVAALQRWRSRRFWTNLCILALVIIATSVWRIYPMIESSQRLEEAFHREPNTERHNDVVSSFVNHRGIITGPLFESIFRLTMPPQGSISSYLGYLPLALSTIGIAQASTRRKILPWFGLFLIFLLLRFGSVLTINGTVFSDVLLPKHYLEKLVPFLFEAFYVTQFFQAGVLLPLAVMSCYGLVAIKSKRRGLGQPFLLLLILLIALEYYIPIEGNVIEDKQFAFLDWLSNESVDEIALVNLPMGRKNSMRYGLYQSRSGYPHAEGAISRTPDSAYNYIRANLLLNTWRQEQPINCELADRAAFLAGLSQLQADGFTHVVFHQELRHAPAIKASFRQAVPSYADEYVWIFRLDDLRDACTGEQSAEFAFTGAYTDALQQLRTSEQRHGIVLVFPPTSKADDHFLYYLRHFADNYRTPVTVTSDEETQIEIRRSDNLEPFASSQLEQHAALWLLNLPLVSDAERTPAFQNWFKERFHRCQRSQEQDAFVIDMYLRAGVPCSAMDEGSSLDIQYDGGVRLHNASFAIEGDLLRFYLAWTKEAASSISFSLQFFDKDDNKALQYDDVIGRQLLSTPEIDVSSLPPGVYSIQLIVYDFETQTSHGGVISDTGQRFERELEIAALELEP